MTLKVSRGGFRDRGPRGRSHLRGPSLKVSEISFQFFLRRGAHLDARGLGPWPPRLPPKTTAEGKCESNYQLCKSRLFSLHKKLRENPELMKQYDDVFKEQLMNGVIEQAKNQGVESEPKEHFLCHFGVAR